jgi:hypothetical protein
MVAILFLMAVLCLALPMRTVAPAAKREISRNLSIVGVTLGKTSLAEVQQRFGASQLRSCSSEEEASQEICYRAPRGTTTVVFEAGFSGGWKIIDAYQIIGTADSSSCYSACPMSSGVPETISTSGMLRLGLSRIEVLNLLGTPESATVDRLEFSREWRQPMTAAEVAKGGGNPNKKDNHWDVVDTVSVRLVNRRVAAIRVSHIVTN